MEAMTLFIHYLSLSPFSAFPMGNLHRSSDLEYLPSTCPQSEKRSDFGQFWTGFLAAFRTPHSPFHRSDSIPKTVRFWSDSMPISYRFWTGFVVSEKR